MSRLFNGDFRRKPEQNLGGASRKLPREILIQQAAAERQARQDDRRKNEAVTIIQSYARKWATQKRISDELRKQFDTLLPQFIQNSSSDDFAHLFWWIVCFHSKEKDANRLSQFSQIALKQQNLIFQLTKEDKLTWTFRIQKFLHINFENISCESSTTTSHVNPLAIPLRLIEVFTAVSNYNKHFDAVESKKIVSSIWTSVIRKGYFKKLRTLIDAKIPQPYEETTKAPTPMANSLIDLMLQPLNQDYEVETSKFVVTNLFNHFLFGPFSPQIKYLVIPTLRENQLKALNPSKIISSIRVVTSGLEPMGIQPSIWFTYSLLKLVSPKVNTLSASQKAVYLEILRSTLTKSMTIGKSSREIETENDEVEVMDQSEEPHSNPKILDDEILTMINDHSHVTSIVNSLDLEAENWSDRTLINLSCIGYVMLSHHSLAVNEYRFLYTLAFKPGFIRHLWSYVTSASTPSVFGSPTPLLQVLSRGLPIAAVEWDHILPQLTLFCSILSYLLPTVDDVEFYESSDEDKKKSNFSSMPFTLQELQAMTMVLRDVCVGLIELAYQDTKISVKDEYKKAMQSVQEPHNQSTDLNVKVWLHLFKASVQLLRALHTRDSRRSFCTANHWISKSVSISVEKPTNFRAGIRQRERYQQFVGLRRLTREELEDGGPPLSTTEVRNVTILQEIPFVVPFKDRIKIFQALLHKDRVENRGTGHHFLVQGSTIDVMIRRNYLYEDAFEKLSPENEPDLKKPIRVQLVNTVGLDEAGIDGGGIFREFLNELLKTCFDPNRGLFCASHDRLLYPNPSSVKVFNRDTDFIKHYYFVGRMLGKALYEKMLVELPFATFFLAKILSQTSSSDVDIHHLATLDPQMYKNLVYLKNFTGNIADLGLDFTIVNSDLGETEEIELKPGGKNIPVTTQNRIEYIHLMADYRLNKQIRPHCTAFKNGMSSVIDLDWIRMFSTKELQELISGAPHPVDVQDLKANTKYAGGYDADHPVIRCFWKVVDELDDNQRKQLLKFVTSCSRPPLLGFKDLQPPFCIQFAGKEERLPTSSTCMNLLKLPEYIEKESLKSKLLYAIESGVGFELS